MPSQDTWSPAAGALSLTYKRRIRTWVRTLNYKSLRNLDLLPVNDYADRTGTYNQSFWLGQYYTVNGGAPIYGTGPGYKANGTQLENNAFAALNPSGINAKITNSGLENQVLIKVLGKVADSKVNLAVSLAEARKTSDLILDAASRISRSFRAFKRGNLREVVRLLNLPKSHIHKTWLEYKYGWMPLLMDVKGAAEAFAQQQVGRPIRFSVSVEDSIPLSWVKFTNFTAYGQTSPGAYQYSELIAGKYSVRCKLWCEITNSHLSTLQQLGLTNPALVAWELVPFSFVFDWFISVGDWLTALTALNGVSLRRTMISTMKEFNYSQVVPFTDVVSGSYRYRYSPHSSSCSVRQYARASLIVNPLSLYPPSNVGSLGFTKLITSLALLKAVHRT